MKKRHYTLLFFLMIAHLVQAQRQWTWVEGNKRPDINGTYGSLGISAPSIFPGSRMGSCTWKDKNGNFWLFGGRGNSASSTGLLNDMWKYDPSIKQWTWVNGEPNVNSPGQYGILGLPFFQHPGARENAVSWTDPNGNFWMFGGSGYSSDQSETGFLNDLWIYSTLSNSWTWVGGTNKLNQEGRYGGRSDPSKTNYPGGRFLSAGWTDHDGNLWLFGGFGYAENDNGALNDLWRYSPATEEWTWMKGEKSNHPDAHYGRKGDFTNGNTPGGRQAVAVWKDHDGNFWLYGGENSTALYCDLWVYKVENNQWAWMSGTDISNELPVFENINVPTRTGHPGSRTLATGWVDPAGDLWLFGGKGYGGNTGARSLNNLWKYSISDNDWTLIKGEITEDPVVVFGNKGVADNNNKPGGTNNASAWTADDGIFWLSGGRSDEGYLNQVWTFSPCESGNITPSAAGICEGSSQELTANGGTSYEWRLNNEVIAGQTNAKIMATEPGTYSVIIKNGACSANAYNTAEINRTTAPVGSISPQEASVCQGGTQILTATGGTSYEWKRNGITIPGKNEATLTVEEAGTYSAIITNGSCSGPASNTSVITQESTPAGSITPVSASLCGQNEQILTATGGTSYEWMRDGEKINGETGPTIKVTTAGIYSVIIRGGVCSGPAANTTQVTDAETNGIRYADIYATPNVPIRLNARIAGTHFEWTPATGLDDPSSATPTATLARDQVYLIYISSTEGCAVVDTQLVKVSTGNTVKVYVPTAFTPNGNNINDRLRPLGNIRRIDYFRVFNRWGNMVFQTNIIGDGWDGKFKGAAQVPDTYTWILTGQTADGLVIKLSGKALLIR
ncbi:MAG TPA: kelch repeat-containing protein [Flavitalea sp.]|nr:kelch repeat-containing protein [Flavitalea sp.]